ncbi:MAG: preprotein translocase subunit TatC, partial [Acidimicrobiaceae bacterium]|nr:preprotein translocase subunit TatC [Acidimicrobiaceae bacterium]
MTDAVDDTAPMERPDGGDNGDGGHMTLMEHLAELRNRLIKSV